MKKKKKGGQEVKDILFSSEVAWHGAVRKTAPANYELMRRWTKKIGDAPAVTKYKEQVALSEAGSLRWFTIPEGLLPYMQMELRPGDRVVLFLVYVGCSDRKPLLSIDEYEELDQTEEEAGDELIRLPGPKVYRS